MLEISETIKQLKRILTKEKQIQKTKILSEFLFGEQLANEMTKDNPTNIEALETAIFMLSALKIKNNRSEKDESTKSDDT